MRSTVVFGAELGCFRLLLQGSLALHSADVRCYTGVPLLHLAALVRLNGRGRGRDRLEDLQIFGTQDLRHPLHGSTLDLEHFVFVQRVFVGVGPQRHIRIQLVQDRFKRWELHRLRRWRCSWRCGGSWSWSWTRWVPSVVVSIWVRVPIVTLCSGVANLTLTPLTLTVVGYGYGFSNWFIFIYILRWRCVLDTV